MDDHVRVVEGPVIEPELEVVGDRPAESQIRHVGFLGLQRIAGRVRLCADREELCDRRIQRIGQLLQRRLCAEFLEQRGGPERRPDRTSQREREIRPPEECQLRIRGIDATAIVLDACGELHVKRLGDGQGQLDERGRDVPAVDEIRVAHQEHEIVGVCLVVVVVVELLVAELRPDGDSDGPSGDLTDISGNDAVQGQQLALGHIAQGALDVVDQCRGILSPRSGECAAEGIEVLAVADAGHPGRRIAVGPAEADQGRSQAVHQRVFDRNEELVLADLKPRVPAPAIVDISCQAGGHPPGVRVVGAGFRRPAAADHPPDPAYVRAVDIVGMIDRDRRRFGLRERG